MNPIDMMITMTRGGVEGVVEAHRHENGAVIEMTTKTTTTKDHTVESLQVMMMKSIVGDEGLGEMVRDHPAQTTVHPADDVDAEAPILLVDDENHVRAQGAAPVVIAAVADTGVTALLDPNPATAAQSQKRDQGAVAVTTTIITTTTMMRSMATIYQPRRNGN